MTDARAYCRQNRIPAKQSDLVGPECRRLSQKRSKRRADVQANNLIQPN
jgi:hypothetical protein